MYKIAILGCENFHAVSFLNFITTDKDFSDIEVLGVYSDEEEAMTKLHDRFGVPTMKSPDELKGKVDGVIVTARRGGSHLPMVKPYLEDGIPVFMDKPITKDICDAEEMIELFKKYSNQFSGGSVMKHCKGTKLIKEKVKNSDEKVLGGMVCAPIMMESPYDGFFFYSHHLVEMICIVFGMFPKSVSAMRNKNGVTAVIRYEDFDVTGVFTEYSEAELYTLTAITKSGIHTFDSMYTDEAFKDELKSFTDLLKGGKSECSPEEFIAPVYILNAINDSLNSGKEEIINWK